MTKEELKSFALKAGFDAVGIASAEPLTWNHFADWIRRGFHGEMAYLVKRCEERRNLSLLLEGTKSVITVAKRYLISEKYEDPDAAFIGSVSRYAWSEDYHGVMRDGLQKIADHIAERTDGAHRTRVCVDSAPLLERDFAAQAGIGWVGKHTNLLNRDSGGWFFLGAVLTTLPLELDFPTTSHCGTCRRCLDACPTNAFSEPYSLDARKCISYLTIELKGSIPLEMRPQLGQWIFGCDLCLEACPWNRFAKPCAEPRFQPRQEWRIIDLLEIMRLDEEAFRQRFKGSPILRAKRRGLLRNAAAALGNRRDRRAVPVLLDALRDPEPSIRAHAAWALGEIGGDEAFDGLAAALPDEKDEEVSSEIRLALNRRDERSISPT
ncbi:MAG: tRNA epoxyqueuosine(34) reductase QueG [Candidatus Omnitrophota bacterium]